MFDTGSNGYLFSWVISRHKNLTPTLDIPAVHFGFAMNYDQISNQYNHATPEWFKINFNMELERFKNSFPEDVYVKETNDNDSDFQPVTWEDFKDEKEVKERKKEEESNSKSGKENKAKDSPKQTKKDLGL
jgi:hypothetical protein